MTRFAIVTLVDIVLAMNSEESRFPVFDGTVTSVILGARALVDAFRLVLTFVLDAIVTLLASLT